jgi:hypothetical protein
MPDSKGRPVYTGGPVIRHLKIGYLFLAVGVVLGLWLNYHTQVRHQHLTDCVTAWANRTNDRTAVLTKANLARTISLDELLIAAIRKDQATVKRLIPIYVRNVRVYRKALKTHPIPRSPRLVC